MKERYTFDEIFLPEHIFCALLKIKPQEFKMLKRTSLYAYVNPLGITEEYFMYIHPLNDPAVLSKINIGINNFIRFHPTEIEAFLPVDK